ncbi:MAG: B12-binding domain-containing radical SAM protein [Elusimicrobia bacterium]|nr:B12-binding domain-containing radical SAM protein [Elusimicrobiota bacterium]
MSSNAKILFGQSYYLRYDPKMWNLKQPYAPLGSLYAAGFIRQRGYPTAFFDAMLADSQNEWSEALEREKPKYAVLYEDNFNYLSKMCLGRMREAGLAMISEAKKRGALCIVCGSDATDHPEIYLNAGANFIIKGEGELTLAELLDVLEKRSDQPLGCVKGLYLRQHSGSIKTAERAALANPDDLPSPAWDLINVERYKSIWLKHHGYFSMNVVSTRGCPYRCNWCAKPIWGQRYAAHSPERVADDFQWLKKTYQPDHIWFADDILGLKPGWIERFAQCLEERGAHIPFKCLLRADLVNDATVQSLKQARCKTVWMGAESGSQKILDAMDKGLKVADIEQATTLLKNAGIKVGFFLQLGYSGENRQDVWATIRMSRRLLPDELGISVSYPLPGTVFYERIKGELRKKQNWHDSDDLAMLYRGSYATSTYRRIHRFIHRDLMLRRSWKRFKKPEKNYFSRVRDTTAVAYHAAHWLPCRIEVEWALRKPKN